MRTTQLGGRASEQRGMQSAMERRGWRLSGAGMHLTLRRAGWRLLQKGSHTCRQRMAAAVSLGAAVHDAMHLYAGRWRGRQPGLAGKQALVLVSSNTSNT